MGAMHLIMRSLIPIAAVAALAACGARKHHDTIAKQGEQMRVELAETYIAKGAPRAAIPLLQRAIAERPGDPRVRVLYGTVLRDLGLYAQAEQQFRFALAQQPGFAPAHAGLGILFDLRRETGQALKHHRRAVKLAPGQASYRNNLGFSLYLSGDTEAAIAQLERALALDPALAVGYNNIGFAYGRLGEFDKAERSFRAVGSRPATLINMSLVYEEHGDDERAATLREQAYALAPDLRPIATTGATTEGKEMQ
jgi:Flp pilus assembly protein TadD